jgi:hypothetical protein
MDERASEQPSDETPGADAPGGSYEPPVAEAIRGPDLDSVAPGVTG